MAIEDHFVHRDQVKVFFCLLIKVNNYAFDEDAVLLARNYSSAWLGGLI